MGRQSFEGAAVHVLYIRSSHAHKLYVSKSPNKLHAQCNNIQQTQIYDHLNLSMCVTQRLQWTYGIQNSDRVKELVPLC